MRIISKSDSLFYLIKSLSKAEKRHFRLHSNVQKGEKVYLSLFEIYEDASSPEAVEALFEKQHPVKNFEMAYKHLFKVIMDSLIKLREKQDPQTAIFNYISKAEILFERGLFGETLSELNNAKRLAVDWENDLLLQLVYRMELKCYGIIGYENINEKKLAEKYMKLHESLKYSHNLNFHLQLYDILRYRTFHQGYVRSKNEEESLNDLVLRESQLIRNQSYSSFEVQKLHYLFQATYFLNIGNIQSASHFYKKLLELFEKNEHFILNTPIYYLNTIEGILNSFHVALQFQETPFYISKLEKLEKGNYSIDFLIVVKCSIFLFSIFSLAGMGKYQEAIEWRNQHKDLFEERTEPIRADFQIKYFLISSIIFLGMGDLGQAKKNMSKIFQSGKLFFSLPSYKIARLVNLLIQVELNDYEFCKKEIYSIKRSINYGKNNCLMEKVVFKFVQSYPLPYFENERLKLLEQYEKDFELLRHSKYDQQFICNFDIISWIESKLSKKPFQEILQRKFCS